MTWGLEHRPKPIEDRLVETVDTLGQPRTMQFRKWRWLIGMTDLSDEALIERIRIMASDPTFLQGP